MPRLTVVALIIFMLVLLNACGTAASLETPGVSAPPEGASAQAPASPAAEPAPTNAATPASAPASQPAAGDTKLLWPEPMPEGLRVDVAQSWIGDDDWTLTLYDPNEAQNIVWIRGGRGPWAEGGPRGEPVTVRGVEGYAFSTGAGWGVLWTELPASPNVEVPAAPGQSDSAAYNVGGFLLSAERAVAIAETLQPIDDATFLQRIEDAGNTGATDRQLVYASFDASQQRSELRAVALESGAEQVLATPGAGCTITGVAVSPDGEHIAYSVDYCATPGLHLVRADGSDDRVLIQGSSQIGAHAFGPDGTRIALLRLRSADPAPVPQTSLWTVAVDDGAATPIVPWSSFIATPAWLDNGLLVYSQAAGGTPPADWTTYAVEAHADAEPRMLRAGQMLAPAPARDALLMAWETEPGTGNDVVRLGLLPLGGEPRLLDQAGGPLPPAAWSPDGASIAVYDWNAHALQTVDIASGQRHDIAYSAGVVSGMRATWTADGKLLTAMGVDGSAVEVRLYDLHDSQARVVATLDGLPDFVALTK